MRVTRGGAEEGAWRLEALGRDGEYTTFDFETREGADAAQELFERHGIVQLGEDEDGRPMRPSPEQLLSFLSAADSDPFIKGVIMWAADDTQTTPDLWQTFSNYQWKDEGRSIPAQPLGWAKVHAGNGGDLLDVPPVVRFALEEK